ncbi:GNAT superfamily N-acetyltransferase [Aeromicrobium panaciterrae]|uniref:GNAT superfamily N-acetyltransferase n=1 Tax=Aeromicrobium panaciterrae TaxID=363861 RepID=A0ABU1UP50_9ACTN|nr:GNAT family N-acetyltransferase [Aeromicrobium panaciterrae]MDR7086935.1 GNAT superfamily N-acetyltransferase [Aeromicrobium panaciterrae]
MLPYDLRPAAYDSADAQVLTDEVQLEYVRRYGSEGGDINPIDAADFVPPVGQFFVAYVDDVPAAMGGWRRHGDDAEIRRMYVRPQFQRRGLARAVLDNIESTAREAGFARLILETGLEQPEAIELYRSAGYADIPAFGFYAEEELSVHLGKQL